MVAACREMAAGDHLAPVGHERTGSPIFCTVWTLRGTSAISLPLPQEPAGMQLVGARGRDATLLTSTAWLESRLQKSSMRRAPSQLLIGLATGRQGTLADGGRAFGSASGRAALARAIDIATYGIVHLHS